MSLVELPRRGTLAAGQLVTFAFVVVQVALFSSPPTASRIAGAAVPDASRRARRSAIWSD